MKKILLFFLLLMFAFGNQLSTKDGESIEVIDLKPENDPVMRWADDKIIYNGEVAYNPWAMDFDIDDEAIAIDYHRGDTLRAVVTCVDSTVRIFKSDDNGTTWTWDCGFAFTNCAVYEPKIIHAPSGGYFHVFCRLDFRNGDIFVRTYDSTGASTDYTIEGTTDTVLNYTVCSDRVDHYDDYYLYCAFHKALGGLDQDQIWFTRSLDKSTTWEANTALEIGGYGFPDLCYGSDGYVYLAFLSRFSNNYKSILSDRSPNRGAAFMSAQVIEGDTAIKQGPQTVAAHDGSGDVWVIFPKRNPAANYEYGLRSLLSQDSAATWSSGSWVNSYINFQQVLPSISVFDGYGSNAHDPYVTFIRSDSEWNDPVVYTFWWQGSWSSEYSYNDSVPALTRPIQTWSEPGVPAIAYVGENGINVYYDFLSNVAVEEQNFSIPKKISIDIYPNPFTNTTHITYSLPAPREVKITVYNTIGQEVSTLVNDTKEGGTYELVWSGIDNKGFILPKGVYLLKIETNRTNTVKKVIFE
ncbi:hypothetical protein AMJ52_08715 [candidate division TA06 bacterium DG_78]|uniref:Secretion system C-terminal sorting domain-containing protein n=1 Tax=candidate division TA06 bacterium DG_78 TaxID=1703772 RepID=A0A0S7Y997_UNCT6|nr:MAG: hypothetical protein AMJ52_08715 [candidate division TA06 bacterium DG_78]